MKQIQAIIIDDSEVDINYLATFIRNTPSLALKATYTDPVEAVMNLAGVELLFLDVHMEELSGLKILERLSKLPLSSPVQVVLTTSSDQYGVQGYKYDITDYLLKPFDYERFLQAIQKVFRRDVEMQPSAYSPTYPVITINVRENESNNEFILQQEDIIYVEASGNYVKVFTTKRPKEFYVHELFGSFRKQLSDELFVQTHRSYMINMKYIQGLQKSKGKVILLNEKLIDMSEKFTDDVGKKTREYRRRQPPQLIL